MQNQTLGNENLIPTLQNGLNEYGNRFYLGMDNVCEMEISAFFNMQRYKPGGGYKIFHCERAGNQFFPRTLAWMIYLNDIPVENGGATDFLHQNCSFQPTTGTMVMWPATYTHMHRGAFLTGDIPKYIATGWFLREPGNVTNRIIGEGIGSIISNPKINE